MLDSLQSNSAGRLHWLVTQLRAPSLNGYEQFHDHLARLLGVSPVIPAEFARPFLLVLQLPDMAQADILGIDEAHYNRELIMQWYSPVREALGQCHLL
jgi:hypothetical protein